jgi:hypothetical protein
VRLCAVYVICVMVRLCNCVICLMVGLRGWGGVLVITVRCGLVAAFGRGSFCTVPCGCPRVECCTFALRDLWFHLWPGYFLHRFMYAPFARVPANMCALSALDRGMPLASRGTAAATWGSRRALANSGRRSCSTAESVAGTTQRATLNGRLGADTVRVIIPSHSFTSHLANLPIAHSRAQFSTAWELHLVMTL